MKSYDLGIVGLGSTGKEHLKYYKNKNIKNIYISEIKSIKQIKKLYELDNNLEKFKKSYNEKILSISNFDKDHAKLILKHYKNSNIFVEKPMCQNLNELNLIKKLIKKENYKNLLFSNLVLRSSQLLRNIIKDIRAGKFGEIYYFEGDYLYGRVNKLNYGWRGKDPNYSVTLGGGIHLIDLMINFFNDLPTSVTSYSNKIVTRKSKFKYPDFVQSNFFKNGSIGKITSNFGCVYKHQHVLKIFGTKKHLFTMRWVQKFIKIMILVFINLLKLKNFYNSKAALLPMFFSLLPKKKRLKNIFTKSSI